MGAGVVIVGAGQGGFQLAASLRDLGYADAVTLIGDEPYLPYNRPPLSKAFVAGTAAPESLALKKAEFYDAKGIELLTGQRVMSLDRANRAVCLEDGACLTYDALVLATGTRNRPLPVPGADAAGVHMLRGAQDALGLRAELADARRVVVVGGGFIGLEVAGLLRKSDVAVTVVEAQDRLCARACRPETSEALRRHHEAVGVDLRLGTAVASIRVENGRAIGVDLPDGEHLLADLVLICIGVIANAELAAEAGLEVRDGIVVDAHLATADNRIFAIGDCARFPCGHHSGDVRLESVPNAVAQARHAAGTLAGQVSRPFGASPWFWSDQGSLKLQMAGVASRADSVEIVARGAGQTLFAWRGERLVGVECIDAPVDFVQARKLLSEGQAPTRIAVDAAGYDLRALAAVAA